MKQPRRRRPRDVRPDMNVTPLVDVVLVLLIIFMVVAPRLEHEVQVTLPAIFNPDPDGEGGPDPLKVTVASGGTYYIGNDPFDLDAVIERLRDAHAADPLRRLLLRGDDALPYGEVRELFARAQEVGFPGIALMVGELHRHARSTPPSAGGASG
jgi:biopolymer transport protein ExbD/biopolymer transport protein TolR